MKKQLHQSLFNSLSNDGWVHGHLSHRNDENVFPKKSTQKKIASAYYREIGELHISECVLINLFQMAILAISMAWMAMKLYIIQKRIE